jgi:hypothetical protein
VHRAELLLFFTLLQLTAIVLAARLFGNLSVRFGNSRAVGRSSPELFWAPRCSACCGPLASSLCFAPAAGAHDDPEPGGSDPAAVPGRDGVRLRPSQESRNRQAVLRIALIGDLFPFALGFAFGQFSAAQIFPQGNAFGYSLFCGTAFSITALPVLGRIMLELDLHRTQVGVVAISAAAINDVVGGCCSRWCRPWRLPTSYRVSLRSRSPCWLSTSRSAGGSSGRCW